MEEIKVGTDSSNQAFCFHEVIGIKTMGMALSEQTNRKGSEDK